MAFILGKVLGCILLMSLALVFDKKKTTKSIIITSLIVLIIGALIEIPGALDGRLISWPLAIVLFLNSIFYNGIGLAVVDVIIIGFRWHKQKWFLKILPWIAGILTVFRVKSNFEGIYPWL